MGWCGLREALSAKDRTPPHLLYNKGMEHNKKPFFSYENSKRVIAQSCKINRQIDRMADMMHLQREQIVHEVNKAVYELAEKQNISVYDICFNFIPVEKFVDTKFDYEGPLPTQCTINMKVELSPVKFELEKGPGYWKHKYFRLKEKMQALIDNKED